MENELLEHLRRELNDLNAEEGIAWVSEHFGSKTKFSTSFGMEDQVVTHIIATQKSGIGIFTLDTGRLFQETYDVFDLTIKMYGLSITSFFPDRSAVENLLKEKGPNSFYESVDNRKECCFIRKVEPLQRALKGTHIWITGLRSDQSVNRNDMAIIEWDDKFKLVKYNPLIHWSQKDIEEYVERHSVPVNTLHRKGFPSIGCAPCTRAVLAGEDPRAGRWWWESSSKECGLHEGKRVSVSKS